MIKKKVCRRGKWSKEYKVKVSVKPIKRKKSGAWGTKKKVVKVDRCAKCGKYTSGGVIYKGKLYHKKCCPIGY